MEQEINSVAQNLYHLALDSGAIKNLSKDDFFSPETIKKISKALETDKNTFFANSQGLDNADKLWESGLTNKIHDHFISLLLEQTVKDKTGFFIDWKFSTGDMVANILTVIPDLDLKDLGETEQCGTWIETIDLDNEKHEFDQESETKAFDILAKVNSTLKALDLMFVTYDTREDNYYFLLIKSSYLTKLRHFGFSEV